MGFLGDILWVVRFRPTPVQMKVLAATQIIGLNTGPLAINPSECDDFVRLSQNDKAFDQISEILLKRMKDTTNWGCALKALMVLDYCVRFGPPAFKVFCRRHEDLIRSLELLPSILSDITDDRSDPGVEARCAGKRLSTLLSEPSFGYSIPKHTAPRSPPVKKALPSASKNHRPLSMAPTPSPELYHSLNEALDGEASGDAITTLARRTISPLCFIEVLHAILSYLVGAAKARPRSDVQKILLLLEECVSEMSPDVSHYFEIAGNRTEFIPLLLSLKNANGKDLIRNTEHALRVVEIHKRILEVRPSSKKARRSKHFAHDREYTLFDFMEGSYINRNSPDTTATAYSSG
ncbi:hypothetical protein FRB94_010233 [Tulasnella sp. JGI-2019a]|nr:hypothetical protein FRB94_010233 [Tulasnella sp. JGI-2019a]KAG9025497.1 hypothetical protein FRB95_010104 [Tulasnella sp. JGI-2019a]